MARSARTLPALRRALALAALLAVVSAASAAVHELRPGDPWPALAPGDTVRLAPGSYSGPWEIDVAGVRVEAQGATLVGPAEGSALILTAPDVEVRGLAVRDAGAAFDLYAPDAAAWLLGCDRCRLTGLDSEGTPAGLRIESSRDVRIEGARLRGAPEGPGVTAYQADGLEIVDADVRGFLDGVYVERSDDVRIAASEVEGARRYGLHVMFGAGLEVTGTTVAGGGVGSAVMYGRDARLTGNRFAGHVGPLAYGLLLQEMDGAVVEDTALTGNTVGALVVSAPAVRIEGGTIAGAGPGLLVRRTPDADASAVRVRGVRFAGNVADVAVDDPEAAVTLRGNAYDAASPLDRDGDGVSDAPYLPTSSFALLSSREPDLSLFAGSPGVQLWAAAEATVPGLRMASLHDAAPRPVAAPDAGLDARGAVAALATLTLALAAAARLAGLPRRRAPAGAAR
jgi:nitrous oxidase accessory protein